MRNRSSLIGLLGICLYLIASISSASDDPELSKLISLYKDLHRNPEISFQEANTAKRLAEEFKQAGFDVTTQVGGHGVVAILKNGAGPTVMVRTDMDALPVQEQTGKAYASTATTCSGLM